MYASHASYGERLNLGSPETDLLVEVDTRTRYGKRGLYGARITGGGAGGTVAVLCDGRLPRRGQCARSKSVRNISSAPASRPAPFVGSSPGAILFGARQIMRG